MTSFHTFGIEEEYFVFHRQTGDAQEEMPAKFFEKARQALGKRVTRELLQSQIEIGTSPCTSMDEARRQLSDCRSTLQEIAGSYDLGILAAGTHPSADWSGQIPTESPRYEKVAHDLQMIARRKMICGMHVHVEVPSEISRVDLMTRTLPFIPLLLALSASSPFWQARRTGLMCYRQSIYGELPRSGLPDLFRDEDEYEAYVGTLVDNRIIKDASFLWWVIRPSTRLPTLELRIMDVCTRVDDAIALAALYRCLLRHLAEHPSLNHGLTAGSRAIVEENKWIAQRYGIHGAMIDLESGEVRSVAEMLRALQDLIREDAEILGCSEEVASAAMILKRGTSADRQLAIHRESLAAGETPQGALINVVDWLANTTARAEKTNVDA